MTIGRSRLAEPNGIFLFAPKLLALVATSLSLACGKADSPVGIAPPTPHLTIEVRYLSTVSASQRTIVADAVDKWTRALSKNLGEFRLNTPANECFRGAPALNETHHNPLVFFSVANVDGLGGLLAYSQICAVSSRDALPLFSHIRVDLGDIASMEERGVLRGVILHELGHVLGFVPNSYLPKNLTAGGAADPHFSGPTAREEFRKHGAWYTGVTVPLEDASGDGPNDPHWRFLVFGDEVMSSSLITGYRSPLSAITLGLFQDLGYEVDFSVADPYEVRPLFGGNRMVPEFSLANDLRSIGPPAVVTPIVHH
ncbi:MAG: leishmanolysin [Gemmatimonadota bacterium]|nr:leishmanolysin [Gemmatimonadota bacterium]